MSNISTAVSFHCAASRGRKVLPTRIKVTLFLHQAAAGWHDGPKPQVVNRSTKSKLLTTNLNFVCHESQSTPTSPILRGHARLSLTLGYHLILQNCQSGIFPSTSRSPSQSSLEGQVVITHVLATMEESDGQTPPGSNDVPDSNSSPLRAPSGWDGKLRVPPKQAVLTNPEVLSDPENYSDEDAPPPETIEADEDLLDDEDPETEEIDLVHARISSLPALKLERFSKVKRLCLRQNAIQEIELPPELGSTLLELELYDNILSHIRGLDTFDQLTTLDLSFNKIKHIKNLSHMTHLRDLYFVSNRISKIENLDQLTHLRQIELGSNRLRDIENLELLTNLEELWLGKNKISTIPSLSTLTKLKILDIKSNRLTNITNLASLPQLEELYVSHNAITTIDKNTFSSNPELRVLDLSNNRIEHLENLHANTKLEEFWASANQISSFAEVERELKDKKNLTTVYFEGNPLQTENEVTYRNKVRLSLPQVQQIDASKFARLCSSSNLQHSR